MNITLSNDAKNPKKCYITCKIGGTGFKMLQCDEKRSLMGSKVMSMMPPFAMFITGGLSFYANVLGAPKSSSYWCPWGLLSHPKWKKDPNSFVAEECTLKFISETVQEKN
jgi:hypothetical protein